jgi:hypothetical protein
VADCTEYIGSSKLHPPWTMWCNKFQSDYRRGKSSKILIIKSIYFSVDNTVSHKTAELILYFPYARRFVGLHPYFCDVDIVNRSETVLRH